MNATRKYVAAAVFAAVLAAGCGTTTATTHTSTAPPPAATATHTSPPPQPVADPHGKYTGSADYLLASGIYDQNYLIGEVDLTNTGNTAFRAQVTMGWPLLGSPDYTATKTVRVPYGATKVIRFHVPVGTYAGNGAQVIDQVQSWQSTHTDKPYGTIHVKILGTYGPIH